MNTTSALSQARTEWDAWQLVVTEARTRGIDLNVDERFYAAITAWAEELVALRQTQDARVVDRAYFEATGRFDRVYGEETP